jgi:hypothetical protein
MPSFTVPQCCRCSVTSRVQENEQLGLTGQRFRGRSSPAVSPSGDAEPAPSIFRCVAGPRGLSARAVTLLSCGPVPPQFLLLALSKQAR